jgi:hypothetical protein
MYTEGFGNGCWHPALLRQPQDAGSAIPNHIIRSLPSIQNLRFFH